MSGKKIISFVWNNFDSDDRVKKKAETLSKKNKVLVVCVPKPQDYKVSYKALNKDLGVVYIKTKNMIDWVFKRIIINEHFWKNNINENKVIQTFINFKTTPGELLVDCNDPDTLYCGKHLLDLKVVYKTIYDAHEYHKDNFVHYPGLFGLYSLLASYCHKLREQKYKCYVDKIILVSKGIKNLVLNDKTFNPNKPIYVIPNFSKKYIFSNTDKDKIATFVGGHSRPGLEKIIPILLELNYKVNHIGNIPKKKIPGVNYKGHLSKLDFMKCLENSEIGILYYDTPNKSFEYSCPNKFSDYVQTNNIIIYNTKLKEVSKMVNKYNLGFGVSKITDKNKPNIKDNIQFRIDTLKHFLQTNKYVNHKFYNESSDEFCWENNEDKLYEIYK